MTAFLKKKGMAVTKLSKAQIRDGNKGADLDGLTQSQRAALLKDAPLWFYILREAEFNAGRLKGVGARIVAETFTLRWRVARHPSFTIRRGDRRSGPTTRRSNGRSSALRLLAQESSARAARLASLTAPALTNLYDHGRAHYRLQQGSRLAEERPWSGLSYSTRIVRCSMRSRSKLPAAH
jgi:hypothetical protein